MEIVNLPRFCKDLLARQRCPECNSGYSAGGVEAFGRRRNRRDGIIYFWYEVECFECKNATMTFVTGRNCDVATFADVAKQLREDEDVEVVVEVSEMADKANNAAPITTDELIDYVAKLKEAKTDYAVLRLIGLGHSEAIRRKRKA